MVPSNLVALAHQLADAARPIAARYFRTGVTVDDKSDLSPVTIADREAETAMRELLTREVPDHGVFGEEHGAVRTDAARTAPKVIDAPAGSLCRKITQSGEWAYVAFANDSRGWIPLADIESLETTQPAPPKLRPAKGSESNA